MRKVSLLSGGAWSSLRSFEIATRTAADAQLLGVRWQAQRDTALGVSSNKRIQSAIAASLCRRTP